MKPNFVGFSTIDKYKKFTLVDRDLVKRDLLNAFLIRAGTMPGRPEVGTRIWDYIFDPNDSVTSGNIEREVRRIVSFDPRLELHDVVITSTANTIIVKVSVSIQPDYSTEDFYINFSKEKQTAIIT